MDKLKNQYLIIIAGPTAVGKTDLTLRLAHRYDAEIFSCDSRQIYRELNIGTAKPDANMMGAVKHHFIDEISVQDQYSVGDYLQDFDKRSEAYFLHKSIALLTGGTGLYIKAILNGLNEFPDVPAHITDTLQQELETEGIEYLQQELVKRDPVYAVDCDLDNKHRLIRALSIIRSSGKPFSYYLNQEVRRKLSFIPIKICLERDREALYARINQRVDTMIAEGLEEEARALFPLKHLKALQTVGYREFFRFFEGEISREEAIRLIKRNTRRYAKRQMTWFRNQDSYHYFHPEALPDIEAFIEGTIKSSESRQ